MPAEGNEVQCIPPGSFLPIRNSLTKGCWSYGIHIAIRKCAHAPACLFYPLFLDLSIPFNFLFPDKSLSLTVFHILLTALASYWMVHMVRKWNLSTETCLPTTRISHQSNRGTAEWSCDGGTRSPTRSASHEPVLSKQTIHTEWPLFPTGFESASS